MSCSSTMPVDYGSGSKMPQPMWTADVLCAGLPALLETARATLAGTHPVGVGVVSAEVRGQALFVYCDAFGSAGYMPRADDLPKEFVAWSADGQDIDAAAFFARNPGGLVESRMVQAGLPDEFERP